MATLSQPQADGFPNKHLHSYFVCFYFDFLTQSLKDIAPSAFYTYASILINVASFISGPPTLPFVIAGNQWQVHLKPRRLSIIEIYVAISTWSKNNSVSLVPSLCKKLQTALHWSCASCCVVEWNKRRRPPVRPAERGDFAAAEGSFDCTGGKAHQTAAALFDYNCWCVWISAWDQRLWRVEKQLQARLQYRESSNTP